MIITLTRHIKHPPQRIVSLVPSQTELLNYLGLEKEVIGITKFCVHPAEWHRSKTRVGGTKNVNIPLIKKLAPDLIICNKEENTKGQVEELAKEFPVWVTDVNNLEEAFEMINHIGELTHKVEEAAALTTRIKNQFFKLQTPSERVIRAGINNKPQTCYLIWQNPYMTVGGDTFINDMMKRCGLENIFAHLTRYPEITAGQLSAQHCQLIILSSEPYPFKQKHIDELKQLFPGKKIILADGEMFSWYGSRLLEAPKYFARLLNSLSE